MEIGYYLNNIEYGEAALILGSRYNQKIKIKGDNIKEFLLQVATINKVNKVIKMLAIDEDTLDKHPRDISNLESTLIVLAYQLLKGKELVVNYLDVLLNYKEEIYLKRVLAKLAHNYDVKIAVFTNNIKFCFELIDKILIVKDKEIVSYLGNDFYNLEIYKYIDMPDIIDFIIRTNNRGIKLDKYLDLDELIKGIYRIC
jgi:hypothetical protein